MSTSRWRALGCSTFLLKLGRNFVDSRPFWFDKYKMMHNNSYVAPVAKVVILESNAVLCTSNVNPASGLSLGRQRMDEEDM